MALFRTWPLISVTAASGMARSLKPIRKTSARSTSLLLVDSTRSHTRHNLIVIDNCEMLFNGPGDEQCPPVIGGNYSINERMVTCMVATLTRPGESVNCCEQIVVRC